MLCLLLITFRLDEEEEEELPPLGKKGNTRKKAHCHQPSLSAESDSLRSTDDFSSCNATELGQHLYEVLKTKEKLESERVDLLDNLCKQVDLVKELKVEVEELNKGDNSGGSRPSSLIGKADSSNSLSSQCANCISTSKLLFMFYVHYLLEFFIDDEKYGSRRIRVDHGWNLIHLLKSISKACSDKNTVASMAY